MRPGARPHVATRRLLAIFALLLLTAGAAAAAASHEGECERIEGAFYIEDELIVAPGDCLIVAPGARLEGPGHVIVRGHLAVEGVPDAPAEVRVPLRVGEGGVANVTWANVTGIQEAAVTAAGGKVRVGNSNFDGNAKGVLIKRAAEATIVESVFSEHTTTAVHMVEGGIVHVTGASFTHNEAAIVVEPPEGEWMLVIKDTAFSENARHVDIRPAAAASGYAVLSGNHFGTIASGEGPSQDALDGTAIRIQLNLPDTPDAPTLLTLRNSTITGAPLGLHADGTGYRVLSQGNAYEGNGVGARVDGPRATFDGDAFRGNARWDVAVFGAWDSVNLVQSAYDRDKLYLDGYSSLRTEEGLLTAKDLGLVGAGFLGALTLALATVGRDWLVRTIFVPLYTRIAPSEVLDNDRRRAIMDYVTDNPGVHMRRIGHALDLSYGSLHYHLHRLESEGYVTHMEEGLFKRYYPAAGRAKRKESDARRPQPGTLRRTERSVFDAVVAFPGEPQAALAERLGLSRQALHYHIKKLENKGFITKVTQGRETLCYPLVEPQAEE